MEDNRYLNQANFFTRSFLKVKKEIHKDFVYLVQSNIDFFGEVKNVVTVNFSDYLKGKGIKKNDTYSFSEFTEIAMETKNIGGAFYNKITNSFVYYNLFDNIQIDPNNPESLKIELAKFGKVFFYQEALKNYITEVTPKGKTIKYNGHTQIENKAFKIKGFRRKKFFEIISQFKNTGFCKIAVLELKMYLGYIEFIDRETKVPLKPEEQMRLVFIPQDKYELKDSCPRYSIFERDFLIPAINSINKDHSKDINNLKISKKYKSGRRITHLEFTMNALGKNLTDEEKGALEMFTKCGLDKQQVFYLLKRIGYKEMYGRYMHAIERVVREGEKNAKYYERESKKEIENIPGYFYKVLYPELQRN